MTKKEEKAWLKLLDEAEKITKLMAPLCAKTLKTPSINWFILGKSKK